MKKINFLLAGLISVFAAPSFADAYGFANGRTANFDNQPDLSVEGALALGDFTNIGARINYKLNPDIILFGDFALNDFDNNLDGTSFGGGAFYQLRNINLAENTDFALKAAYRIGSGDNFDYSEFSFDAIISGNQLSTTDLSWYGNVGFHRLSVEVEFRDFFGNTATAEASDSEILIGGGVVGALSFGEWYAGIDIIDELLIVGGIRYNL